MTRRKSDTATSNDDATPAGDTTVETTTLDPAATSNPATTDATAQITAAWNATDPLAIHQRRNLATRWPDLAAALDQLTRQDA